MAQPSKPPAPIGQIEVAAFMTMMAIMAYLGRDNPDFVYPQILWSFIPLLLLNLLNFSFLAKRLNMVSRMEFLTGANLFCMTVIIRYSGREASYFWVLFLVPVFSAALFLDRRGLFGCLGLVGVFLANLYRDYLLDLNWPMILEMVVKLAALLAAAVITRRVSLSEQEARRTLDKERAETIRDRLEARDKLQHLDRLATMGTLAASITHELNGPLTTITMASELEPSTPEDAAKSRQLIQSSSRRCVQIVKDMLAFSRQQEAEKKPADLNALVAKCVMLKKFDWVDSDLEVAEDYDAALKPLSVSGPQLQQVIFNLLTNAEQALRAAERHPGRIRVSTKGANGRVSIAVEDNGPGIPKDTLKKIGEPFFTTKPQGQGTGLGVSISRKIVEGHGGKLLIESEPGKSTTFTVDLPRES